MQQLANKRAEHCHSGCQQNPLLYVKVHEGPQAVDFNLLATEPRHVLAV